MLSGGGGVFDEIPILILSWLELGFTITIRGRVLPPHRLFPLSVVFSFFFDTWKSELIIITKLFSLVVWNLNGPGIINSLTIERRQ